MPSPICRRAQMRVYVAPLMRLSGDDLSSLANHWLNGKLPTFPCSVEARSNRDSLLTNSSDAERTERLARRIALDIQRIVDGEDAATIEVSAPSEERLVINMHTAQLIGFSPRWDDLADAVQLAVDNMQNQRSVSLLQALNAAIGNSPTLHEAQLGNGHCGGPDANRTQRLDAESRGGTVPYADRHESRQSPVTGPTHHRSKRNGRS